MTVCLFLVYIIYLFIFKVIVRVSYLKNTLTEVCLQHVLKVCLCSAEFTSSFLHNYEHIPTFKKASLDEMGKGNKWRTSSLVLKLTYNYVLCYDGFLYGSIINKSNQGKEYITSVCYQIVDLAICAQVLITYTPKMTNVSQVTIFFPLNHLVLFPFVRNNFADLISCTYFMWEVWFKIYSGILCFWSFMFLVLHLTL